MAKHEVLGEGRFASTWQNRVAGQALRAARLATGDGNERQATFAARLADGLGVEISSAALSNWESGRRGVPAVVLLEAAMISGISIDALFAKADQPAIARWIGQIAEVRGAITSQPKLRARGDLVDLSESVEHHDELLSQVMRELSEQGKMLARLRSQLRGHGITLTEEDREANVT